MKRYWRLLLLFGLLFVLAMPVTAQETVYFPTTEWRASTPEAQGLDSAQLVSYLEPIFQDYFNRDSLVVIRHGYIVAEAYAPPYTVDMKHHMYSMSKSVTSALIGIMIGEGYLDSLDTPVLSLFPDRTVQNVDANKQALTVRHLLTMTSGFDCHDDAFETVSAMQKSDDWLQFALDLPMATAPGTEFNYCSPVTYILSGIITEKTGKSALDYAVEKLFAPLGITDYAWTSSPQGISLGYSDLQLTTRDMAKFGLLFLRGGQWEGKQIIPADYVAAAISHQTDNPWPDSGYGFQWWLTASDQVPSAIGYGAQYILLDPEKDIEVVTAGGFTESLAVYLMGSPLHYGLAALPAANTALPENLEAQNQLGSMVAAISHPMPVTVGTPPDIATQVTGQDYMLARPIEVAKRGALGFTDFLNAQGLHFDFSDPSVAQMSFALDNGELWTLPVGLDGIYQESEGPLGLMGVKGEWDNANTFRAFLKYVGDAEILRLDTTFLPGAVQVLGSAYVSGDVQATQGIVLSD